MRVQQYKWLEQLYPKLFERVKAKVLEGKFHPVGGSWVENDANMPSVKVSLASSSLAKGSSRVGSESDARPRGCRTVSV